MRRLIPASFQICTGVFFFTLRRNRGNTHALSGQKERTMEPQRERQWKQFREDAKKTGIPHELYDLDLEYKRSLCVDGYRKPQIDDKGHEQMTVAVYLRNGSVFYCGATMWEVGQKFITLFLWEDFDSGKYEFEHKESGVSVRISEISHCFECFTKVAK